MSHYWPDQDIYLEYFSPSEFDHPEIMDASFLKLIDTWRKRCSFAIYVTGDGRTEEEHRQLYAPNPAPDSAHPKGLAIDCKMPSSGLKRVIMAREALKLHEQGEWPYLGLEIATRHIHVENYNNPTYNRPTVWAGVSK